ncbi:hypothetical protein ABT297_32950 [Dactylosporangium sp. NPDC000555]|uniref:hypothetical protein n=1 Tax=Dactylosporangium sp. NPDC000555 TaxID=3154260 RepID=UPI003324A267
MAMRLPCLRRIARDTKAPPRILHVEGRVGPDLSVAAIREDRILDGAHATGCDVRRLADLFGLSIRAGTRYTDTVDMPS